MEGYVLDYFLAVCCNFLESCHHRWRLKVLVSFIGAGANLLLAPVLYLPDKSESFLFNYGTIP